MGKKGTKMALAQRVFGVDFFYEEYQGKTEMVSIPYGDFQEYSEIFTEEELAILLNRIVRIDFVNYSNRKPSVKVDAVKVFLGNMATATAEMTDAEKVAWLNQKCQHESRIQMPMAEEEETEEE